MYKLTILGSSGDRANRLRVTGGAIIQAPNYSLILDPGEGCLRQLILLGLVNSNIKRIFISNFCLDHCQGLPSILDSLNLSENNKIEIFYPFNTENMLNNLIGMIRGKKHNFIKRIPLKDKDIINIEKNEKLYVRLMDYFVPTLGVRYDGENNTSIAFIMDTIKCQAAIDLALNVNLLVCQASDVNKRAYQVNRRKLMTALDAANIALSSKVGKLLLNHFNPRLNEVNGLLYEARNIFKMSDIARDLTTYFL